MTLVENCWIHNFVNQNKLFLDGLHQKYINRYDTNQINTDPLASVAAHPSQDPQIRRRQLSPLDDCQSAASAGSCGSAEALNAALYFPSTMVLQWRLISAPLSLSHELAALRSLTTLLCDQTALLVSPTPPPPSPSGPACWGFTLSLCNSDHS